MSPFFYASDSGSTEKVAALIAQQFSTESHDIADADIEELEEYDLIVLGTPTINDGEIQSDWGGYVLQELEDLSLSNTKVAVFGLGDQIDFPDTFVDGMADLANACKDAGATIIGRWPSSGYQYSESRAEDQGEFIGLAIDVDRQADLTQERVIKWTEQLKGALAA